MIEIPTSPNFREPQQSGHGPCIVCGRAVKSKRPSFVFVHCGGTHAVTEDEADNLDPRASLGFQPIGPECLRRFPELKPYSRKLEV